MATFDLPDPTDKGLPNVSGPALSFSQVNRAIARGNGLVDRLHQRARKSITQQLDAAGATGARLESKILSPIQDRANASESVLVGLRDLIQNYLAAGLAPGVAQLSDLQGALGDVATPAVKDLLALPTVTSAAGPQAGSTPGGGAMPTPPVGASAAGIQAAARSAPGRAVVPTSAVPAGSLSGAAGGPAGACPPQGDLTQVRNVIQQAIDANPPDGKSDACRYITWIDYDCRFHYQDFEGLGFHYPGADRAQQVVDDRQATYNQMVAAAALLHQVYAMSVVEEPLTASCHAGKIVPSPVPITPPTSPPEGCCIDVTCPPPVINIPPCPPVSSQFPDCLMIDLCNWDKLCSTLRDCLKQRPDNVDCSLDNADAWVYKDCDGSFGADQSGYWSDAADTIVSAGSIDQAVLPSAKMSAQSVQVYRVGRDLLGDLQPA